MLIGLERSKTEIYDRIVLELSAEFGRQGHSTVLTDPAAIANVGDLLAAYRRCDWVVITNSAGLLSLPLQDGFLFEAIPAKLAFIHHDAPFNTTDLGQIQRKLEAFLRIRERSLHFSIENCDQHDLGGLGIPCQPLVHMSTVGMPPPLASTSVERSVAFIGHAVPPIQGPIAFGTPRDQHYFESYLNRVRRYDHRVKEDFDALEPAVPADAPARLARLSRKAQYVQYVNAYSLFMRGAVLQDIGDHDMHIFGGDPAWIHGVQPSRFIVRDNIRYYQPIFEKSTILDVFRNTAVNLNITSLQFDSAVINRLLDCAAAGGFMLTDAKDQLDELTTIADEISFATTEELLEKLAFYLDPSNRSKRLELARILAQDIRRSCSLAATIGLMLDIMSRH